MTRRSVTSPIWLAMGLGAILPALCREHVPQQTNDSLESDTRMISPVLSHPKSPKTFVADWSAASMRSASCLG